MSTATPKQIQSAINSETEPFYIAVNNYDPSPIDIAEKDRKSGTIIVTSRTPRETKKQIRRSNKSWWAWIFQCMGTFGDS